MKQIFYGILSLIGVFCVAVPENNSSLTGCNQSPPVDTSACYLINHTSSSDNFRSWRLIAWKFADVDNIVDIEMVGAPEVMKRATRTAARTLKQTLKQAGYEVEEVKVGTLLKDDIDDSITLYKIRVGIKLVGIDSDNIPSFRITFTRNGGLTRALERFPYTSVCVLYENEYHMDTFQHETVIKQIIR